MKSHRLLATRLSCLFLVGLACFCVAALRAQGQEAIATFPWEDAIKDASPAALAHEEIQAAPAGMGGKILKIYNHGSEPLRLTLLTIVKPHITAGFYGLRGQVRYDDVVGDGHLDMWNDFPGGGHYFSRTLGDRAVDPMAKLTGTSDWRDVSLPFNATASPTHPNKLTINIVLPGHGTVFLTPLELFQLQPGKMSVVPALTRPALVAGGAASAGFGG